MKEIGCLVGVVWRATVVEQIAWGSYVEYLWSNSAKNLDSVKGNVSDDQRMLEVVGTWRSGHS